MDALDDPQDSLMATSIARLVSLNSVLEQTVNELRQSENLEVVLPDQISPPAEGLEDQHLFNEATALIRSIENSVQSIFTMVEHLWGRNPTNGKTNNDTPDELSGWNLGTFKLVVKTLPILRGSVEVRTTVVVAPNIPLAVIQFVQKNVPGIRDYLARENHGHWGYHYHYIDQRNRRSDTLLTFSHTPLPATQEPILKWEIHSENHGFKARANTWGNEKRKSIYAVCGADATKFKLHEFKRPSHDSMVVWPLP